ncbi:MAG: SDR family oxidoreductase [Anaerohalosphaeraceae bacterium]|nr:SDR family oxidoreductase [Anaerohalosphaeraceae bacterium]
MQNLPISEEILDLGRKTATIERMKKPEINKKTVLITGCSSGFGLLTAVTAAKAGLAVIATMRNPDKAARLKQALADSGTSAIIDTLDVTDPAQIKSIIEKYGPIDILVNNAGILMGGSFLTLTDAEARGVFETDYFGAVELTRQAAAGMIEQNSGMIINVASLAGRVGHLFNSAYGAAKHALIGFSRSIRLELKPFNIKVVSVEPGYHKTGVIGNNANLSENFHDRKSPMFSYNRGFFKLMTKEVIPRAGDPQKVADRIVKIMLSKKPKSHYIIGKDAKIATFCQWLGLLGLLEKITYGKLLRNTERAMKKKR